MPPTHRDRIVEALRLSSLALDDDQLSQRTGIEPRQAVNQACRALERAGVVRRYQGPAGKIVNELISSDASPIAPSDQPPPAAIGTDEAQDPPGAAPTLSRASGHTTPPGSSREQRDAERVMLDLLAAEVGRALEPATVTVPAGARVELDGADAGRTVLVECWAHQGTPKAAQRHKVLADALKLTWIATTIYPRPRLILCMSDAQAAAPFLPTSRSWAAQALQDLGVAVVVVELPPDVRQRIRDAQQRQYR
jgi:hypothetical protein